MRNYLPTSGRLRRTWRDYQPLGLALLAASVFATERANAAGLYFSDRGVRPLARGGAFVAGADDLGAIYYNPAGIVDAGSQILFDASWLRFSADYTRTAMVTSRDPNTGATGKSYLQTFESVHGSSPILPIPTLAGSYAITRDIVVAAGVYAPYSAITSYPERQSGQPAPQRYSLVSLDGSALSILGAWVAWRPIKELSIGAGPTILVGTFQSSVAFGACVPDRFLCAQEQPEYDAKGQLTVGTIKAPSGTLGATITPHDMVRVGISYQLPYFIDSPAKFQTRLPSADVFEKATIEGEDARVTFKLPWVFRIGVEARPLPRTRAELAFVYEKWSMHDRIQVTPDDTVLRNVALFPPAYRVGSITLDRNFQDAWSIRAGGEHAIDIGRYRLDARAGIAYEKSAVPASHLSVLTVDMDKITLAVGGGLHIGPRWRFDGLLAVVFPKTVEVDPNEAALYKVNPVRSNRQTGPDGRPTDDTPINAGTYTARALVLGLGLRYQFGVPDAPAEAAPENRVE